MCIYYLNKNNRQIYKKKREIKISELVGNINLGVGRERMRGREVGQELRKKQKELGNSIENGAGRGERS